MPRTTQPKICIAPNIHVISVFVYIYHCDMMVGGLGGMCSGGNVGEYIAGSICELRVSHHHVGDGCARVEKPHSFDVHPHMVFVACVYVLCVVVLCCDASGCDAPGYELRGQDECTTRGAPCVHRGYGPGMGVSDTTSINQHMPGWANRTNHHLNSTRAASTPGIRTCCGFKAQNPAKHGISMSIVSLERKH